MAENGFGKGIWSSQNIQAEMQTRSKFSMTWLELILVSWAEQKADIERSLKEKTPIYCKESSYMDTHIAQMCQGKRKGCVIFPQKYLPQCNCNGNC